MRRKLLMLLLKIIIVEAVIYVLFFLVFGLARVKTNAMAPSINGGDLALFFHLDDNYETDDVATYIKDGKRLFSRVIAKAGDTVDVREGQFFVNGRPIDSTKAFIGEVGDSSDIVFPYNVGENDVFLVNDDRDEPADSRKFGAINIRDLDGKVISIVRTRGI